MATEQTLRDPREIGVGGLTGLSHMERPDNIHLGRSASEYNALQAYKNINSSPIEAVGDQYTDIGKSAYDTSVLSPTDLENIQDVRAEEQPWYAKIAAGLAKGAVLAGTTFLDGTVGLIAGAATAIDEDRVSGLWDNDFSRAMKSVNDSMEELLPNYYSQEEQEAPWYENIFTANFIGDKFIKNLGFSVGALYSGGVWTKGLTLGGKLSQAIGLVAKSSKAPAIVNTVVGAGMSALNEGRIEALNNSTDWYNAQKEQLDNYVMETAQGIIDDPNYVGREEALADLNSKYEETLTKLNEDRAKMGNVDMLMNLPILMASNIIQFGKFYANGYKTARKVGNIVGKAGEYTAGKSTLGGIASVTKGALSEGTEEISQGAASRISGNYYEDDVNNFYKAKIDPEAEQKTLSWMKSFAQGINETVNDGNSWEEFFIGTLTGALGIPTFKKRANGKWGIGIEGGAINEFNEYKEQMSREQEIADYMNSRVHSPEFLNYYRGLIRHNKYQDDMNRAAENGDEFEFKNAEHAQLISDIVMFDNAGKLGDLKTLISSSYDTSDENLDSIVRNTTTVIENEDGSKSLSGPFAQYAYLDEEGNIATNLSNEDDKQLMIEKLTQSKDEMLNTINEYQKIKDNIDISTGERLTDEQLEELTWMRSQLGNWAERAASVSGEVKQAIGSIIGNLQQFANFNQQIMNYEGQHHTDLTDRYKEADKNIQSLNKAISTLDTIRQMDDKSLAAILANNSDFVDGLVTEIEHLDEDAMGQESKDDIIAKLRDIVKLGKATQVYKEKLTEYLKNPEKQAKAHEEVQQQAVQDAAQAQSASFKQSLNDAQNMEQFREAMSAEEDPSVREAALKEMEDGGSEMAKNYRETEQYNNEVQKKINESDASEQEKADALTLLQDQYAHSETLEQIANPNSVFVTNEYAFEDSSDTVEQAHDRFVKANYLLQDAMNKANEDIKFKDRFSAAQKAAETGTRGDDREETGDSGTATVPPVNPETAGNSYQPPIGDIRSDTLLAENKETNGAVDDQRTLDSRQGDTRKYYRPAIPELHIEASKEGDFRPFNIVAAEREGANFDAIYQYLVDSGAFDYINSGKLSEGDEIRFTIDPAFEEKVKDFDWHKQPTVFMITKDGQIVGSLDESISSVSRYEGLASLQEKVRREYEEAEDKTNFKSTISTRVAKMMAGKIPFSNTERSLAAIPGVSDNGTPILGVIKNGTMATNNTVDDNKVIKPVNMAGKEGRLYLLIPNGAGKYSPAAVRVKHFNKEEFDLDDVTVSGTPIGKDLTKAISKLAESLSEEDVTEAVKELNKVLYTGNLHIDFFNSKEGNGIRITKVEKDANGNEIYDETPSGRKRREISKPIFLTEQWDKNLQYTIGEDNQIRTAPEQKNSAQIEAELRETLMSFNLPLQVSISDLGKAGYVQRLINSNILTSNIDNAKVIGNWFVTDYFDGEGKLQAAISPASVTPEKGRKIDSPVGGKETVINGTPIVFGGGTVYVDLQQMTITTNGTSRSVQAGDELLCDLAWAQNCFGNATEGATMIDNKVVTPSGKVLDRTTQKYLNDEEASRVKDAITKRDADRAARIAEANKVVEQIRQNQSKVDRTKTDNDYYYILEDDGNYHQYERVHKRLGNNWIESKSQTEALDLVRTNLSKNVDDEKQYDNYLTFLENKYDIKLSDFRGKTDITSRNAIVNAVRDKMSSANSRRALNAGTAVDSVIRQYFTIKDVSKITKPDNMSESAYLDLLEKLRKVKESIEANGEKFITDNAVLFVKYPDGTRIAGEVDILAIDKDGNFKIYDVKTSRYSFYEFEDKNHRKVNYFKYPSPTQRISTEAYYTLQLSAYKNLFESQYHLPITKLGIMPFVLGYEKDTVTSITGEKGIPITYNPAVNVPLLGTTPAPITPTPTPTSTSTVETAVTPAQVNTDEEVQASFERNGVQVKEPIKKVATIGGTDVYVNKEPNITKGFGRADEVEHVASYNYWAVFPNGKSVKVVPNVLPTVGDAEPIQKLVEALSAKPKKVQDLASEPGIGLGISAPKVETTSTILSNTTQEGASATLQTEQTINPTTKRTRRHLRAVDSERSVWNQEKELKWLEKVLPQLTKEKRVSVVKGLIKVAEHGPYAWGQFSDGIVTLSDIAAEGTTYHEAFHVVFGTLLNQKEKEALYAEARNKFGNRDEYTLEELMAEDFREYVMTQDKRGLGRKILDFFRNLFDKVTNWEYIKPSLNSYYRAINQGRYVSASIPTSTTTKYSTETYTQEMQDIKAKAIANGTFMKAPNGKESNLNERQWLQVRTKAFKDWFGDWENNPTNASKVVDENGEPLIVYHGSPVLDFNTFELQREAGFHFGSKAAAESFGNTRAFFLNIKIIGHYYDNMWFGKKILHDFVEDGTITKEEADKWSKEATGYAWEKSQSYDYRYYDGKLGFSEYINKKIQELKGSEYGISYTNTSEDPGHTSYLVFNPNQIKSATDNIGTFSSANPDIRYRLVSNEGGIISRNRSSRTTDTFNTWGALRTEERQALFNKGWTEQMFNKISQEEREQALRCIAF